MRSAQRRRTSARPLRPWRRGLGRGRAVSDVVATILILAITVTLFASLFAFVDSFPPPPAQSVNQFRAALAYTANDSYISSVSILMTAGPVVSPSDSVYMKSAANPSLPAFQSSIPVAWGINNATVWTIGQSWVYTFGATHQPKLPDNITVFLVSTTELLYSVTIPGSVPNLPPSVAEAGTTPSTPALGGAFQFYAEFTGNLTGGTPTLNIAGIPGLSGNPTLVKYNGLYVYNVSASSTTTAGTYDAWLSVTNGAGQTATAEIPVTITSSSGGGGSSTTVSVGMSPQPPTLPQQSPSAYFWATVWYPGSKVNVPVSVNFTITQVAGGRSTTLSVPTTVPGQTGLTITGPSSLTIYSQAASNFNTWLLNSSVTITATVTLGMSVGTFTGSIEYATQNLVSANVYVTTSSAGATSGVEHTFSHSCNTLTSCPYVYIEVWDNFTAALGGPATLTISGLCWANTTTGATHDEIPTTGIASTTVTLASSPQMFNLYGGTTRETQLTSAGTYSVMLWLTVKSTVAGTPTIGYIYDTFSLTVS